MSPRGKRHGAFHYWGVTDAIRRDHSECVGDMPLCCVDCSADETSSVAVATEMKSCETSSEVAMRESGVPLCGTTMRMKRRDRNRANAVTAVDSECCDECMRIRSEI